MRLEIIGVGKANAKACPIRERTSGVAAQRRQTSPPPLRSGVRGAKRSIPHQRSTGRHGDTAGYPGSAEKLKPRSANCRGRRSATRSVTRSVGRRPSTGRSCERRVNVGTRGSGPTISGRREHAYAAWSMSGNDVGAWIVATPTSVRSIQTTLTQTTSTATSLAWCSYAPPRLGYVRSSRSALPGARDATGETRGTSDRRNGGQLSECPLRGSAGSSYRTSMMISKLSLGCADCGWSAWARGLDWDHARGQKTPRGRQADQRQMARRGPYCGNSKVRRRLRQLSPDTYL